MWRQFVAMTTLQIVMHIVVATWAMEGRTSSLILLSIGEQFKKIQMHLFFSLLSSQVKVRSLMCKRQASRTAGMNFSRMDHIKKKIHHLPRVRRKWMMDFWQRVWSTNSKTISSWVFSTTMEILNLRKILPHLNKLKILIIVSY